MRILHFSIGIALLACQWQASAGDTTEAPQYTIKQSAPSVGYSIKRDIIKAGSIPLDRRYAELTPEQKNILKSEYESMKADDEPPFPTNGLKDAFTALRRVHEQYNLKYKGPLTMYVQVDSHGKATGVSVVRSPDPEITQAMAYTLMVLPYKPAVCSGQPCAMQYPFHAELIGPDEQEITSGNPASGVMIGHNN
jgi:hypothetical protein